MDGWSILGNSGCVEQLLYLFFCLFVLEQITVQLAKTAGITRPARLARKKSHIAWCDNVVYLHGYFPNLKSQNNGWPCNPTVFLCARVVIGKKKREEKIHYWAIYVLLCRGCRFIVDQKWRLCFLTVWSFQYDSVNKMIISSLTTLCIPKPMCSPGASGLKCFVILKGADLPRLSVKDLLPVAGFQKTTEVYVKSQVNVNFVPNQKVTTSHPAVVEVLNTLPKTIFFSLKIFLGSCLFLLPSGKSCRHTGQRGVKRVKSVNLPMERMSNQTRETNHWNLILTAFRCYRSIKALQIFMRKY